MPLAQWNIPPPMIGELTLADFDLLTDAIDEELAERRKQAARPGR